MPWIKHGVVLAPPGETPWMRTHAALPVVIEAGPGQHRLLFSSRDADNRAHIGAATLALDDPAAPPLVDAVPLLSPGSLGAFDDAGVTSSCLVEAAGRQYLYYTGWALGVSVPFYLAAGLATSDDGGRTFTRHSEAPLLDRDAVDPYLSASPWVLIDEGRWRMWYVSGTGWRPTAAGPQHRYHIKYAESADGVRWDRHGRVCIDYASDEEYAFGRPCVVRDGGRYRMWYSFRGTTYRMGYAESADGLEWERRDGDCVLEPSAAGWDAEMVTYPMVLRDHGSWLLFYNGNGYGRSGIGLARWAP